MELLWRSVAVCLVVICCLSFSSGQSTFDGQLRDLVGVDGQVGGPQERRAVVLFASNASDVHPISGKRISSAELLALASDMEDRDPNSLFVHFDGENLISSQPILFNDFETPSEADTWPVVLEKVEVHRPGTKSPLADLLVFQSHPADVREQVEKLCGSVYSSGKCQFLEGQIDSLVSSGRFRRAVTDTTTPSPKPNPSSILPVMPYTAAFQLLFWTTLAIALAVYGVSYAMWNMDPGRDSIIYRMTSAQKYKKDK